MLALRSHVVKIFCLERTGGDSVNDAVTYWQWDISPTVRWKEWKLKRVKGPTGGESKERTRIKKDERERGKWNEGTGTESEGKNVGRAKRGTNEQK